MSVLPMAKLQFPIAVYYIKTLSIPRREHILDLWEGIEICKRAWTAWEGISSISAGWWNSCFLGTFSHKHKS